MDAVSIVALALGGAGLLGGVLWGWAATRTAARLSFKIVGAAARGGTDAQLVARVAALEAWKAEVEAGVRSEASDATARR
jgi:hypothetical protein